MTIEQLYTIRLVSNNNQNANPANGSGAPNPATGNGFIDLILAKLEDSAKTKDKSHDILQSDNPLLEKNPKLAIERLLDSAAEAPSNNAVEANAAEKNDLTNILALNQKAFEDIIKPMQKSGELTVDDIAFYEDAKKKFNLKTIFFIDEEANTAITDKIKAIAEKLQKLSEDGQPHLIATNLTPQELAELQQYIDKDQSATPNTGVFAGFMTLSEPQTLNNDLGAYLNSLTVGGSKNTAEGIPVDSKGNLKGEKSFGDIVEDVASGKTTPDAKTAPNEKQTSNAGLFTLSGFEFNSDGSLLIPQGFNALGGDELYEQSGAGHSTSLSNLTSLVTQAPSATQAHPTSQMIAATLQKSAAKGQDTTINLQLDPPELGRIEVSMHFSKDKGVKAVMNVEKPETLLMLQRDAQMLERALQDAGLDVSGDSLSFNLAQDSHNFNQDGRHDGARNTVGRGDTQDSDITQDIESTMDWYVDPDTGHMHYNIVA